MIGDGDEAMIITAGDAARNKRNDDVRRRGRRSLLLDTQTSYTQTESDNDPHIRDDHVHNERIQPTNYHGKCICGLVLSLLLKDISRLLQLLQHPVSTSAVKVSTSAVIVTGVSTVLHAVLVLAFAMNSILSAISSNASSISSAMSSSTSSFTSSSTPSSTSPTTSPITSSSSSSTGTASMSSSVSSDLVSASKSTAISTISHRLSCAILVMFDNIFYLIATSVCLELFIIFMN